MHSFNLVHAYSIVMVKFSIIANTRRISGRYWDIEKKKKVLREYWILADAKELINFVPRIWAYRFHFYQQISWMKIWTENAKMCETFALKTYITFLMRKLF